MQLWEKTVFFMKLIKEPVLASGSIPRFLEL